VLITNGHLVNGEYALVGPPRVPLQLVFNSMAQSLLQGRFDVDPAIVGLEGFVVNDKVVAYWGIPFALIRLPLALFPGGFAVDVTALSSLIAVCVAAGAKLRTIRLIFRRTQGEMGGVIYWLIVLTILFSGPQIEFLKSSPYQEVCLWAGALGALFVYRAFVGLLVEGLSTKVLCSLCAIAGTALMCRVSTGIGLCAACGLLLAGIFNRRTLLPLAILLACCGIAGFVNQERWGDPLTFADFHLYIDNWVHPDRLVRMQRYGLFNVVRIPLSFLYYFFPVWVFPHPGWAPFIQVLQTRLFDFSELPPGTFLVTDALLVGFMICAIRALCTPGSDFQLDRMPIFAIAAGLTAPCALMLTAISLSYRYRIDFYPLLEFLAFIGIVVMRRRVPHGPPEHLKRWIGAAAATSIGASGCALLLYKLSPFGPGIPLIQGGFWAFYGEQWQAQLGKLAQSFH
jgi:hypothetical protein